MWLAIRLFAMTGVLGGVLLSGTASLGEEKSLEVGDTVSEFKTLDDQGRIWNSRDHIGKRLVVIYFYPGVFAFCCTRQAQRYRDKQRELANFDVEVIGISGDAVETHRMFKEAHQLNHTLLSDADGSVARQFGVPLRAGGKAMPVNANGQPLLNANGAAVQIPRDFSAARWTFVIDRNGRIIYREADVSPKRDIQEVLEFLCEHSSQ